MTGHDVEGSHCRLPGQEPPDLLLTAEAEESGLRLDVFLSRRLADRSRSRIRRWIEDGRVTLGGGAAKARRVVEVGDLVQVWLPADPVQGALLPSPMALDILFEDDHIIVVNKAPGVVVHPGAGHWDGTLVQGLLAHTGRLASQGSPLRPGIVHRLDQDTSGVLVAAKSDAAYLDLIQQFKDHEVGKEYLAIVHGAFKESRGEIRTGIDRHARDRKKMAVVHSRGREAISQWEVEEEVGEVSIVRVRIHTGRTHQIRVHFSHLQHPVVGDSTYGGGRRRVLSLRSIDLRRILAPVDRQMLHAWRLSFRHPASGAPLSFTAEPPMDFANVLRELRLLRRQGG
ncbi:MAG: RluA family pseudouridine synthase [Syntrophobacteraceae bacterium]|jgi:23S rRNA pseudouridine1911/1915/1917 synthase|nr:RluA family pseudouridine synthase [Syntrophobacteraceae bacterium]